MAWKIEEKETNKISENESGCSCEKEWDLYTDHGSATISEARTAFSSIYNVTNLRDIYGNLPSNFEIEEVEESLGQKFIAKVTFSPVKNEKETLAQDNPWWMESFDTTGGQAHITHGYDERRIAFYDNDTLPDFEGGIGWNGEGFDGCDIITPAYSFQAKTRIKYEDYHLDTATLFAERTGTINNDVFCGIPRHCCQFKGAQGSVIFVPGEEIVESENGTPVQSMTPYFEITCSFQSQPITTVYAGNQSLEKAGYDYCWTLYRIVDDYDSGMTIKRPRGIYCNQVYRDSDFSWFGLQFFMG